MKVQFGIALAEAANANAYITIPGLKGMPAKEISVKNLSQIIQARMQEILDFVVYNLKVVGLDGKNLNGGVILTGGGSQLKHIIQLTEYATGLTARIGLPTEHLAPNHIEELKKPMYSTCLGLILKGYDDYENKYKDFTEQYKKVVVPKKLTQVEPKIETIEVEEKVVETPAIVNVDKRKKLKIWDRMKHTLIELFKEEDDKII
jgi:cell division protein FtsA